MPTPTAADKSYDHFTEEEERKYERRFESGYDIYCNPRYVKWIETYYPDFVIPNTSTVQPDFEGSQSSSIVSKFLKTPDLPHVTASKPPKGPRVLTSVENVKMLMEKEQSKREIEEMKRLKKEERLKKAEERKQQKLQKRSMKGQSRRGMLDSDIYMYLRSTLYLNLDRQAA